MPSKTEHKEIPFNGKLITADPAAIGQNFQTLTNLRYTDTHLRGIGGMTKINSAAVMDATYLKTRSAFHFKKSQPAETHVLVQAYNTGLTAAQVLENKTAIPGAGSFEATELLTDSTGFGLGRFSNAPDGQVIYCNGVDACIWGGNEMKAGAFVTSTAAVTNTGAATSPKDYTDIINNTKTDANNVAIIGGGIDSYTKLMMHLNALDSVKIAPFITDSVGTHTPASGGDYQADSDQVKFGISSALFDGTGDYLTIPDHADFNLSTGTMTYDK